MKRLIPLTLLFSGCTPSEVAIVEEVVHEASVAEEAIVADMTGHPCNIDQTQQPIMIKQDPVPLPEQVPA